MYRYNCRVVKIVDGDTVDVDIDLGFGVWLNNQRIRISGIDAPENRTRDLEEKEAGQVAAAFVEKYLPLWSQQVLISEEYNSTGKYGRILGTFQVYDHKTDRVMSLSDIMIREHYAVAYHGQSREQIQEQHLINRAILREQGIL